MIYSDLVLPSKYEYTGFESKCTVGKVQIPESGKDTIPSPDRMEECIARKRFGDYTFADDLPPEYGIPNPITRQLRLLQTTHLDEIPSRVLHSADENSYYKVRKGWWILVLRRMRWGVERQEFTDSELLEEIQRFREKYTSKEFSSSHHLTTGEDIGAANNLIDRIWSMYGQ